MPPVSTAARMLLGLSPFRPAGQILGPGELLAPLTLTRAQLAGVQSSATGADGATLGLFGADVARFQGTARRLLIEGQRTNLLVRSAEFDNASWNKSAGSITATDVVAPDGTATAETFTSSGADGLFGQGVTSTAVAHVASVWLRVPSGTRTVNIYLFRTSPFALVTQVACNLNTTWQRFSVLGTFLDTSAHTFQIGGANTLPNGAAVQVWGAQLEAGAFASTHIPTTSAAATRGADVVSASLSSLGIGGNGACTVLWSGMIPQAAPSGASQVLFQIDDNTDNNRLYVRNAAGGLLLLPARITSGVFQEGTASGSLAAGTPFRVGAAIDGAGRIAASFNGNATGQATGGPTSGLTTLRIGNAVVAGNPMAGETLALRVLPYTLSDTDLAAAVAALPT